MADSDANDVIDLIDVASRKQTARDLDGLERAIDLADLVAARDITQAAANLERAAFAAGVDPLSLESP